MRKNKKGLAQQLMVVLILGVILAVMVLIFWIGSMILPLITGIGTDITNNIQVGINENNPDTELSNATTVPANIVTGTLGVIEGIVYIALIIIFIGFFALAYYVRTYPFLAFFWIFIIIALTFMSMIVSNSYISASQNTQTAEYYATWGSNDFIMQYLPHIVVFFGAISGIFLFVLASKDPESEVQQL